MTYSKLLPNLAVLLLAGSSLTAQITFNEKDEAFFRKKAIEYQRWLDKTGLGEALKFSELRLQKENTELEMFLVVNSTDLDTAISVWTQVKQDFQTIADRPPLEEKLFRTFVDFMEIPAAQGNIQVYVKDAEGRIIPCFWVAAWEKDGIVQSKYKIGECKSDYAINIAISPIPVRKVVGKNTTSVARQLGTAQVFSGIENFIRNKYGMVKYEDRTPKIIVDKEGNTTLRVTVENLSRVVLTNEKQSLWCDAMNALGISCNDMRRERLEFRFDYTEGSNMLTGSLTGKFGSGVYKPREEGYFNMEPDFSSYIISFHKGFQNELEKYLNRL